MNDALIEGVNFADIEETFVRDRINPTFGWRPFDTFSHVNPLSVPLAEARVAFVSTSGAHMASQPAFDLESAEGDPTYREVPSRSSLDDVVLSHRGYNTHHASTDKNSVFPLDHLRAAVEVGRIGSLVPKMYSTMGFVADADLLLRITAPEIAESLQQDGVDFVLLAPT